MSSAAVKVDGLTYSFAGRDEPTLHRISCSLPAGSWTLITGRTGCGKSTLLRAMAGLIPHHAAGVMDGQVALFGIDTRTARPAELAGQVGMVLQSPDDQICTTLVESEVAFGLENLAMAPAEMGPLIRDSLARVGLQQMERHPTRHLSGGQKQRLLLACILAMQPQLLLLDEPLSQLDTASSTDLLEQLDRLRADGLTIVMVEHRLEDVLPRSDRVLILEDGRLAAEVDTDEPGQLADVFARHQIELPEVAQLAQRLELRPVCQAEKLEELLNVRGNRAAVNEQPPAERPEPAAPAILDVHDISFFFPGIDEPLWEQLTFSLHPGERVALVGPNGGGKTTLLAALAGIVQPGAGTIDHHRTNGHAARGQLATSMLLQNPDLMLFSRTVREELAFGLNQLGVQRNDREERIATAAARFALAELLDESPLALSQGQRLRVALAATLVLRPQVLLLDEPTTAQDRRQLIDMMTHLEELAGSVAAVLFSTHDLSVVARHADRVLVLAGGKLLADCRPIELLDNDDLLAAARLRRPPLFELRRRLAARSVTIETLAAELASA